MTEKIKVADYDWDLNNRSRAFIAENIATLNLPVAPNLRNPTDLPQGDKGRHWHICAKKVEEDKIIRAFRPGAYTIYSSEHNIPVDKTVVVVIEENNQMNIVHGPPWAMDEKFDLKCYTGIN